MAAFLRVAASRFRPWVASAFMASVSATAVSLSFAQESQAARCDSESQGNPAPVPDSQPSPVAASQLAEIPKVRLPVTLYLPELQLYKIQLGLEIGSRIATNRLVISEAVAKQLQDFEGCELQLKLEYIVCDGLRKVIEAKLFHTDVFGDLHEVEGASAYLVVRDQQEQDEMDARGFTEADDDAYIFATAKATVDLGKAALLSLGPMAEATDKWEGYILEQGTGHKRFVEVQNLQSVEVDAVISGDKSWNAAESTCDGKCPSAKLVEVEREPQCGFCTWFQAGPCSIPFQFWSNRNKAIEGMSDDEFVKNVMRPTMLMRMCAKKHEWYYEDLFNMDPNNEKDKEKTGNSEKNEKA